ncbi:MAG: hypothetical protein A2Z88_02490 [Omnitrophica WOR_2 bacterium GWA2_47_8]|nr:MAG: hypothetical protein A2Z88_02490 [Omnitrophica WOR_2 bacterium GWA2_47_8]
MSKGKVKEYDSNRGYGVIIDFDSGLDLPVYANSINLKEGETLQGEQNVEYEIENNRHNNRAINVRISLC